MAVVVPPSGPPPAGTAGGTGSVAQAVLQALGEVVVEQVPARIALLARTILLSGTVVAQQEGGALVLRTQVGELIIRSQTPLPLDKVLTLQIPPGAPPVRAQVSVVQVPSALPVNVTVPAPTTLPATPPVITSPAQPRVTAQPDATPLNPLARLAGNVIATPLALQAAVDLPLLPGTVLPAQVLAVPDLVVADDPQQPAQAKPQLAPAVEVQQQVQQLGAPALKALLPQGLADVIAKLPPGVLLPPLAEPERPAPVQTQQQPGTPVSPRPAQPAFASLPVMLTLPPGSHVTVQVVSIVPPPAAGAAGLSPPVQLPVAVQSPQPAPVPAAALQPVVSGQVQQQLQPQATPTFTAVVVGHTAQRAPIATSPAGLFVLESQGDLPTGTTVELSIVHVSEPEPDAVEDVLPERRPRDWPVLQQLLATPVAQPASAQAAPHIVKPEAMGTTTLFLLAALKLAKPEAVVPDDLLQAAVARGQGDLLPRFTAELQQNVQSWTRPDAPQSDWRTLLLPLPLQGQLTRLVLHTRQEREAQAVEGVLNVKRLVVELELSRLGPLLLDGYIRPKRMDMTLRSQKLLKKDLKDELRLTYRNTLGAMGWQGEMEFQTAAELWLGN